MITDFGHTAFSAYDIDRTLKFYALLGIHEAFRLDDDNGSLVLVYLHIAGDRFIEVFANGPAPDPETKRGFRHMCLLTDDLFDLVTHLREAAVPIDREPTVGRTHNWQAWIRDPDGNAIELMQLVEESPQWQAAHGTLSG